MVRRTITHYNDSNDLLPLLATSLE